MHFSKYILHLWGWKVVGNIPDEKKMIVVSVPHTSNWDFIIGRLFMYSVGLKPKLLMKKELFFFPLGWFLRKVGGIPVDRKQKNDIIDRMVYEFEHADNLVLVITPEGTRKKVSEWKKGFYYIAASAHIPVVPGYFDYKKKTIGIGEPFFVSENIESDINRIKEFVKDVTPKYPHLFTLD
jgi:1-acyl-sn-glycerol-3-phosphate acyltransferase